MTKVELIKSIADSAGITQVTAELALQAVVDAIKEEVTNTGRQEIAGLGVFKAVTRAACLRPNPSKPGEKVQQAEHQTVTFRPAPVFREAVNA
jgi:DNA-binding protein HU-beta